MVSPVTYVSPVCNPLNVQLGGIKLNFIDDKGCKWVLTEIDGWQPPEPRYDIQDRALDDGAWISGGYFRARRLTLNVTLQVTQTANMQVARELRGQAEYALLETLAGSVRAPLDFALDMGNNQPIRNAVVRLATQPQSRLVIPWISEHQFELVADDPLWYGDESAIALVMGDPSGGLVFNTPAAIFGASGPWTFADPLTASNRGTLVNTGSVASPVTMTFIGPLSNPVVTLVGVGHVALNTVIASGDYVVVDTRNREILHHGTIPRRDWLAVGSTWVRVPPGGTAAVLSADVGSTGTVQVSARSAWL